MIRRTIATLFVVIASFFVLVGVPQAQAHVKFVTMPLDLTCYGEGNGVKPNCDGYTPPPISACQNNNSVVEYENFNDINGLHLGQLQLRFSDSSTGCYSYWANTVDDGSNSFTITAIGIWQESGDGSNYGGLDSMPHTMHPGNNESTKMVGDPGGIPFPCFHAALDYKDQFGNLFGIQTASDCD